MLILESIWACRIFYLVQFRKRQMTKRKYGLHWYESSKREKEEVCHWSSIGMNLASQSGTALTSGDLHSYLFLQPSKSPPNLIFFRLFELHIKFYEQFWNLLKTSNCSPQFAKYQFILSNRDQSTWCEKGNIFIPEK